MWHSLLDIPFFTLFHASQIAFLRPYSFCWTINHNGGKASLFWFGLNSIYYLFLFLKKNGCRQASLIEEEVEELVAVFLEVESKVTLLSLPFYAHLLFILPFSFHWLCFYWHLGSSSSRVAWKGIARKNWSWSKIGVIWEASRRWGF
jgi:hypothetical protein